MNLHLLELAIVLARHYESGYVSGDTCAADTGFCLSTVERLASTLKDNGLVGTQRGPGGGYRLQQDPYKISVTDLPVLPEDDYAKVGPVYAVVKAALSGITLAQAAELQDNRSARRINAPVSDMSRHISSMWPVH